MASDPVLAEQHHYKRHMPSVARVVKYWRTHPQPWMKGVVIGWNIPLNSISSYLTTVSSSSSTGCSGTLRLLKRKHIPNLSPTTITLRKHVKHANRATSSFTCGKMTGCIDANSSCALLHTGSTPWIACLMFYRTSTRWPVSACMHARGVATHCYHPSCVRSDVNHSALLAPST